MNPWNQISMDLRLISRINHQMNRREISEIEISEKSKLKLKLTQIFIRK